MGCQRCKNLDRLLTNERKARSATDESVKKLQELSRTQRAEIKRLEKLMGDVQALVPAAGKAMHQLLQAANLDAFQERLAKAATRKVANRGR